MEDKLISVILPVYNSQEYVKDTIQSVLNQTYKNFELIVVNDGSTDKTGTICENLVKKDSRIKYFFRSNSGVSSTRNFALENSIGKYVTFIDSDDLYEENYLQILFNNIEKYKADIVACAYKTLSEDSKVIDYKEEFLDCNFKDYIEKLQPNLLFNQLWNKIYNLEIIKKNKLLFDSTLDLGEDYKFNLEYMRVINKYLYINMPLYSYRITDTGLGFKYRKNSSEIKFSLLRILESIYVERGYNISYVYKNYLIQYLAWFSNIVDIKNDDTKKMKLDKIKNIINSSSYQQKLTDIKSISNFKVKLICNIVLIKNEYLIYAIGKLANAYDKFNKKKKYK